MENIFWFPFEGKSKRTRTAKFGAELVKFNPLPPNGNKTYKQKCKAILNLISTY